MRSWKEKNSRVQNYSLSLSPSFALSLYMLCHFWFNYVLFALLEEWMLMPAAQIQLNQPEAIQKLQAAACQVC